MAKNKIVSVGLLALMIFSMFAAVGVSPVAAGDTVYTNTATFDDYFKLVEINGTVDDTTPALAFDTAKEYFEFNVTITPNAGNSTIIEIPVPDCYMGLDVYEGVTTLKTGTANYTLSVPYDNNSTDVPALDWLALTAANGTGSNGIAKRVQLISNQTAATALTIRVYYATAPAVGFDGVNDYVNFGDVLDVDINDFQIEFIIKVLGGVTILSKGHLDAAPHDLYRAYVVKSDFPAIRALVQDNVSEVGVYKNTGWSLSTWANLTVFADRDDKLNLYMNGSAGTQPSMIGVCNSLNNAYNLMLGRYSLSATYFGKFQLNSLDFIISASDVLLLNASSFSGGASTTVDDFSASDNDGTAYGNVQYKTYTGTGFAFTLDDDSAPTHTSEDHSTSNAGASCGFSVDLADDWQLDGYIFSTNNTGSWANETWADISGTSSSPTTTKTLNAVGGTVVGFRWYINDTAGNWGDTGIQTLTTVDVTNPTIGTEGANQTTTGLPTKFYAYAQDETGLSGYIFSTNNSGAWVNDTWASMTGTAAWMNVTKTLTTGGTAIGYRWYCNDSSGNWADGGINVVTSINTNGSANIFTIDFTGYLGTVTYDDITTGRLTIPCTTGGTITISGGLTGGSFIVEVNGAVYTSWTLSSSTITITGVSAGDTVVVDFELDDERHGSAPPDVDQTTPPIWSLPVDIGGVQVPRIDLTFGVAASAIVLVGCAWLYRRWKKSRAKVWVQHTLSAPAWSTDRQKKEHRWRKDRKWRRG